MCTVLLSLRTISLLLADTFLRGCSKSHFPTMPEGDGRKQWSGKRTRFMDCCLFSYFFFFFKPTSITCPQNTVLAGCSISVGNRSDGDSYGQWIFVKRIHSWWGWEWCCLSTGAKELKVLRCGRDCSLLLIYHGSSARRRDSYRTQPGNSDAVGTCSLCAEQRSWGGKTRGEFFSFNGKSSHSDRQKDVEVLGPCHCIMSSVWAGGTLGCVQIWVQE